MLEGMYQYVLGDTAPLPPAAKMLTIHPLLAKYLFTPAMGVNALVPGASALPTAVGSKLTWKNVGIAGAIAVLGYMAYEYLLLPPPKKPSTATRSTVPAASGPSPVAAVAGLFGVRYRKRRR
jgi:hypothetical protein